MTGDKKEIRVHYLKIRSLLTDEDISKNGKLIFQKIESISKVWEKNSFGAYIAFKNEVDTKLLIDRLVLQKKHVFLPRFFQGKKTYFFVKFSGWKELTTGYYGILQPKSNEAENTKDIDVIFVPGIAFDRSGIRLGWGTGTYDQLLKGTRAVKIGLAYDFQIADSLPCEEHDIKVDYIVSEKRVVKTAAT